ncbi:unnamed protein product [Closterium sp. NIES-53]
MHFGHPSAGGCQRSTGDPRLILGKSYWLVVLGGYGRIDPLLNKPFHPNALHRAPLLPARTRCPCATRLPTRAALLHLPTCCPTRRAYPHALARRACPCAAPRTAPARARCCPAAIAQRSAPACVQLPVHTLPCRARCPALLQVLPCRHALPYGTRLRCPVVPSLPFCTHARLPALPRAVLCHCTLPCCRAAVPTAALRHATTLSAAEPLTYCRAVRSPTTPRTATGAYICNLFLVLRLDLVPLMATITVLGADTDGRPLKFESWLERLHPYLRSEPTATTGEDVHWRYRADRAAFTRWTARDAVAQLVVRAHLSLDQRVQFRQVTSAQTLYDVVVSHYSSLSPASLGHLALPFLLPSLSLLACRGGGAVLAEVLHTFMLKSGTSRCFFRDCTIVTTLTTHVPVFLANPSSGLVVPCGSTVFLCPADPSGSLTSLHLPSFATNLVSTAVLQDQLVTTTTPGGELVAICMDSVTGDHLATFTRRPGFGILPRSMPPIPLSLVPPYTPYFEGRQRAAPHTSLFPLTTAPLQTLHMDVWGPAPVSEPGRERYFLLVINDYTRYTIVFLLQRKSDVRSVLIKVLPPEVLEVLVCQEIERG